MNLQFVGNAPGSAYTYADRGDNYNAMQSYNEAITKYTEAIAFFLITPMLTEVSDR